MLVTITTDGACSGNPGPGGYAAIIQCKGHEKKVVGYQTMTTNNQMELMAVIAGLKALTKPCEVQVRTDSEYIMKGVASFTKWMAKKNLPNRALWAELQQVKTAGGHKVTFIKVKGHSGDELNSRCDKLAKNEVKKASHQLVGVVG